MICALIMAGGKGTRFWPLSTEERPKQFLKLIGHETMLQMTVNRILPIIPIERVFVCTAERYIDLVKEQIPNLPARNIIVEPEGRNTAPCIALSALVIKRYYKDATMVVLPSDHLIINENKFTNIILEGKEFLDKNNRAILTLGMKPDRAETGYGYINFGDNVSEIICKVNKFVEKPNKEKAEEYLKSGNYLWNGGVFIWKINTIIQEVKKYIPNTFEALSSIEDSEKDKLQNVINDQYSKTDSISIDYAVLEKSDEVYVIPSEIGWDDIGTWEAIDRYTDKDIDNNIINGDVKIINSKNNIVIGSKKTVILADVKDLYVIETEERIIIGDRLKLNNICEIKNKI